MNPWATTFSDRAAYSLAGASALGATAFGIISFHDNPFAAIFAVLAGIASGAGIYFNVESSRKRDELLANAVVWPSSSDVQSE